MLHSNYTLAVGLIFLYFVLGICFPHVLLISCNQAESQVCDDELTNMSVAHDESRFLEKGKIESEDDKNDRDQFVDDLNRRKIYWKVTEHGYFLCPHDCLFSDESLSLDRTTGEHFKSSNDFLKILTSGMTSTFHDSNLTKSPLSKSRDDVSSSSSDRGPKTKAHLECEPFENEIQYDMLDGLILRHAHRNLPDPDLMHLFDKSGQLNTDELRLRLIKMKQAKELTGVKLYNRVGNFYRLIGDTANAIECFRKALHLEPHNSNVLINLARLLQKLEFYDDAIYLTRKSIEYLQYDRAPWFQYFTLGEIYKENGFYDDALTYVQYSLKLKPKNANAIRLLNELNTHKLYQIMSLTALVQYVHRVGSILIGSAPSFYLQLLFHLIIILFLMMFGACYNLLNILFEPSQLENEPGNEATDELGCSTTISQDQKLNKHKHVKNKFKKLF